MPPPPTAPDKWTTEPVLVKIYKLILNELRNQMTKAAAAADDDTEEDDDVSDVTWRDVRRNIVLFKTSAVIHPGTSWNYQVNVISKF